MLTCRLCASRLCPAAEEYLPLQPSDRKCYGASSDRAFYTLVVWPAPANKGIGWDVARILAESGVKTVVAARNEELGRQAVAKLQEATGAQLFCTACVRTSL